MAKLGFPHVKTLRGSLETDTFFKIDDSSRSEIRKRHFIDSNCFLMVLFSGTNYVKVSLIYLMGLASSFNRIQNQTPNYYYTLTGRRAGTFLG